MRRILWVVTAAACATFSVSVASQQAATGMYPDKPWAFPAQIEKPFPPDAAPKTLPGSSKKYTEKEIDDLMNPPDWFPDQHPTPPQIVMKGRGGVNLVSHLEPGERARGLVTASTGNHGQSIGFAGRLFGARVVVCVPLEANPAKLWSMRALGRKNLPETIELEGVTW